MNTVQDESVGNQNNNQNTKIKFSNKYLVYSSSEYSDSDNIFLLIKSFKEHTLINYIYGKGSKDVKKYSLNYNHRLLGCDLKTKEDYSSLKKGKIECIFLFYSDSLLPEETILINNIKKFAEANNISIILNNNQNNNENNLNNNQNILNNNQNNLFIDFDLEDIPEEKTNINLQKCLKILKIREQECRDLKDSRKIVLVNNKIQNKNKSRIYSFFNK